jgi:hypothetical protein
MHALFLRDISGKSQIMAQSKQATPTVDFTPKKEKKERKKNNHSKLYTQR